MEVIMYPPRMECGPINSEKKSERIVCKESGKKAGNNVGPEIKPPRYMYNPNGPSMFWCS